MGFAVSELALSAAVRKGHREATGNFGALHILLGHNKIENTAWHLAVDIDDVLELAEHTEIRA